MTNFKKSLIFIESKSLNKSYFIKNFPNFSSSTLIFIFCKQLSKLSFEINY